MENGNASNIRATYVVILLITDQFDISKLFFRNLEKVETRYTRPNHCDSHLLPATI